MPLLRPKEAAHLLGVSPHYVRAHGDRLGIAVHLGDGVVRYDPIALARVRRSRQRRDPPRD
jgi:hypothetical protein